MIQISPIVIPEIEIPEIEIPEYIEAKLQRWAQQSRKDIEVIRGRFRQKVRKLRAELSENQVMEQARMEVMEQARMEVYWDLRIELYGAKAFPPTSRPKSLTDLWKEFEKLQKQVMQISMNLHTRLELLEEQVFDK